MLNRTTFEFSNNKYNITRYKSRVLDLKIKILEGIYRGSYRMVSSFLFRINDGKLQYGNSNFILPPSLSPVTISSVANFPSGADVTGTSVTNGITYNVYAFKTTGTSYIVNYSCANATQIYVLAVGGGGGGGSWAGGGGGAGGVAMIPVSLPSTNGTNKTITVSIGTGGNGGTSSPIVAPVNGNNTTITFSESSVSPIIAYGGGGGGGRSNSGAITSGGSNGGSGYYVDTSTTETIKSSWNYGNKGGSGLNYNSGGGGGAGTVGTTGAILDVNSSYTGGNGGNGIQCFLPGISSFIQSGTSYGSYYWGGGGGGACAIATISNDGMGGLGGGGGGSGDTGIVNWVGGIGGGSALNRGSNGGINISGNGGSNTGGGGGGNWSSTAGTGGTGGSGIVVIAFPSSTTVTSSQSAVLPASIYSSGLYLATLNNASFTPAAYNSVKGAFGCRLLNYNYFGPVMTLRHSLDTIGIFTKNFYSDICGNLGTGYLGTGQPVSTWLSNAGANTTYAFVSKWYGQGMDVSFNCATQYTLASQPVYDVANGLLNFGYTTSANAPSGWTSNAGNAYFNLPNGAYPIGDSSFCYSFSYKYVAIPTNTPYGAGVASATPFAGGLTTPASGTNASNITPWMQSSQYYYSFWNYDYSTGPAPLFNSSTITTATIKYVSNNGTGTRYAYVNKAPSNTPSSAMSAVRTQSPLNNGIGSWPLTSADSSRSNNYFNGQMINFFVFSSALTAGTDQSIIESSPTVFSQLPSMTLTISSLTTTTFAATWTAVANATTYVMYVNSSAYGVVTSGQTITPGSSSPWQINVYAYSATNNLLASGYFQITSSIASVSVTQLTTTSFSVSWVGGIGATSYTYYLNGNATSPTTDNGVAGYNATFSGLTAGYRYSIYIKATTPNGTFYSFNLPTSGVFGTCFCWLDASDKSTITTSSTTVTQWRDKSTNGYNFGAGNAGSALPVTSTPSGTNPIGSIYFNGSTSQIACFTMPLPAAPYTIFVIGNNTTSSGYSYFISCYVDKYLFFGCYNNTSNFTAFCGNGVWNDVAAMSTGISVTSLSVMGITNNNTTLTGYVNGVSAGTKTGTSGTTTGIALGSACGGGGNSQFMTGNICEVVMFNSVLSTTNYQYVEGSLAWKYGCQNSLVAGHPYKSVPPTGLAVWNP